MQTLNLTREIVGRRYPVHRNYLSVTWVRDFLSAIDPRLAVTFVESGGHEVPNVFAPALRDGPFEVFADLDIPLKRLLHVAQEYQYNKPLLAQAWVESETVVLDLKEKSSKLGDIYIMELQTKFSQNGENCIEAVMRVFVRR